MILAMNVRRIFTPAIIFVFVLVTAIGRPVQAQLPELTIDSTFQREARAAVDSLYNMRFDASRKALQDYRDRYPNHPLWIFWEALIQWWHVLPDLASHKGDEKLFNLLGRTDYESTRLLSKQPDHTDGLILKALSNGLMARHYSNREEWVSSLNRARVALSPFQRLLELHPEMSDLMLGTGIKEYYAAYLSEKYSWMKSFSWFLPQGNKQEGLEKIHEAAQKSMLVQPEALYFLGNIYLNHEDNGRKAVQYFQELHDRYPRNPFYAGILVRCYIEMKHDTKALQTIEHIRREWDDSWLFTDVLNEELSCWKGKALFRMGFPARAEEAFKNVTDLANELSGGDKRPFQVMSSFYLGRIYHEGGQVKLARKWLKKAVDADLEEPPYSREAQKLLDKMDS